MYQIVEQKKAELQRKSEQYKEDFIAGYSDVINNPGSLVRLGILSSGLILNSIFPEKDKSGKDKSGSGKDEKGNQLERIENRGLELQFKADYKEKLILVLLEILRQILLMLTEKLVPAHDDPDLR